MELLEKIVQVVKETSEIILEADHIRDSIDCKEGSNNFVTEYDKRVQAKLFEDLAKILPEAEFMGEEEENHNYQEKGYQFIIDPIDGTTNFIRGYQASAISVALLKDNEPYMGVIYNPYRDEIFYAKKNEGAYCNGKPIHVSKEPLERALILTGTTPYRKDLCKEVMDMIARVFAKTTDIRRSGSAALDMAAIASGRADIFFELILSPWDYAGASVLIEEAGGKIFGLDGKPVQFKEPQAIVVCGEGIDTDELLRLCNGSSVL